MDIQPERAFQKQPAIFQDKKRVLLAATGQEKLPRYYKNIELGFQVPKEAIKGTYIDEKCPFTGERVRLGRAAAERGDWRKMQTATVIRGGDDLHPIRQHHRFEKRHKNMSVHLLQGQGHGGDAGPRAGAALHRAKVTGSGTKKQCQES